MKKTLSTLINLIKRQTHRLANVSVIASTILKLDGRDISYSDLVSAIMSVDRTINADDVDELIDCLEINGILLPQNIVDDVASEYYVNIGAVNENKIT